MYVGEIKIIMQILLLLLIIIIIIKKNKSYNDNDIYIKVSNNNVYV